MELVAVLRGFFKLRFRDFPSGDFGGTGNIGCAYDIRMIEMTTRTAHKERTNGTIAFVNVPALRTRPARVAWIDNDDRHTRQLRLVLNESSQFVERSFRHPVSLRIS